jgi:hypothetical protein
MEIQLVGATKPIGKKENELLFVDYNSVDTILGDSTSKEKAQTINALKRFTQNFARVCYSKYGWNELLKEEFKKGLIDGRVLPSKHHSVFEHIWLNLYLDEIPKIGAMVLNNEKQYVTSEKSARYTEMVDLEPEQKKQYNKWMKILIPEIDLVYPKIKDKEVAVKKLAQENARYMTSVFTPTKMGYTVNLRQLNFLISESERIGNLSPSSSLEERVHPFLIDFANQTDSLKIKGLDHKKVKKLSLFDNRDVEEHFGDVYSTKYLMSFAGLAQAHRHRTINYHISGGTELGAPNSFFIPAVIKKANLTNEWISDLETVAKYDFPQAQLLNVNERGIIEDFRLKTTERICGHAQHEIMKNTVETANKYDQYKKEFGEFYDQPKCAESALNCNGACVWGKKYATNRLV